MVDAGHSGASSAGKVKLSVRDLAISYGSTTVLSDINLDVHENEIFGIIGPANAGKTSFLKSINRMDMLNPDMHVKGQITFNDLSTHRLKNVY